MDAEGLAADPAMSRKGTDMSVSSKASPLAVVDRVVLRLVGWLPFMLPRPMAAMRFVRMALASAICSSFSRQTSLRCSIYGMSALC